MKSLISQLLPILLLIFCLISCKKEEDEVVFYGQIIDANTQMPLQNIMVSVGYADCGTIKCFQTINTQKTDSYGNYNISCSSESTNKDMVLLIYSQDSFYHNQIAYSTYKPWFVTVVVLPDSGSIHQNFSLIPQSVLTIHFETSQVLAPGEILNLFFCDQTSYSSYSYGREFSYLGGIPDSLNCIVYGGDKATIISWSRDRNGSGQHFNDSVFCEVFKGVDFVLNY